MTYKIITRCAFSLSLLIISLPLLMSCSHATLSPIKNTATQKQYKVQTQDIELSAKHSEAISARVSYPLNSKGSHTLIVFSHGNRLSNKDYHALTNAWVRQGYLVVAPLHLDTGDAVKVTALTRKLGSDWINAARVLDMRAIIDQIDHITTRLEKFDGQVNLDRIIAAGHSFGALSAQLLAGANIELQGNSIRPIPKQLNDDRVVAVVAISPPGKIPGTLSEKTWETFDKPQLVVTGTKDVFEYIWQDYREHLISYEAAQPGNNYLLVVKDMDHYMGNLIGRLDREALPQQIALDLTIAQSLLFMDAHLVTANSNKSRELLLDFAGLREDPHVIHYTRR